MIFAAGVWVVVWYVVWCVICVAGVWGVVVWCVIFVAGLSGVMCGELFEVIAAKCAVSVSACRPL